MMIISGIINLIVFVLLGIAVEKLLLFATRQKNLNQSFMYFIANICKYFFISVGILTLTAYLGIDIRGILTGLGLTGFALGFALKDALSNFISGIFTLIRAFIGGYVLGWLFVFIYNKIERRQLK